MDQSTSLYVETTALRNATMQYRVQRRSGAMPVLYIYIYNHNFAAVTRRITAVAVLLW
jgi:hypothetical protein